MNPAERRPPDALLILFSVLALAVALTWLVPAGEFRRERANGRQVVVAGSYQEVAAAPAPWHRLFTAPVAGFADRDTARIIAFVLLSGGAFGVVEATGAVAAGIGALARGAVRHPARRRWLVAALMLACSIGGNTFGMSEEVLVFVLLTLGLARRMGWDPLTGVAIPFIGAGVGFSAAAFNPFTVGIAQGISGLPLFSGWAFRLAMWAALTEIAIGFVLRHIARLEAAQDAGTWNAPDPGAEPPALDGSRRAVLALFALGIVTLVVGVARWDWYIDELAG
ncbi:MAG: YfcC family protein, partial [Verrucomicrobiota bacterium]